MLLPGENAELISFRGCLAFGETRLHGRGDLTVKEPWRGEVLSHRHRGGARELSRRRGEEGGHQTAWESLPGGTNRNEPGGFREEVPERRVC